MSFKFCLLFFILFIVEIVNGAPPLKRDEQLEKPIEIPNIVANRPDHLKGVALERDGELNKDFRRELLAGDSGEQHKLENENSEKIITDMFNRADRNHDQRISPEELKQQIHENTKKHLEEGRQDSESLFQKVDENGDGLIKWNEYKAHFMVKNNMIDESHAIEHANQHSENLDSNSRLKLADEHDAFKRADADGDGLDESEWLGFQHPEHSRTMLTEMTNEILRSLDRNKDNYLSSDEFAHLPDGIVDNPQMDKEYAEARRHEFNTVIDLNKDGKASIEELRSYVNPLNDNHVVEEVREIFEFADEDKDGYLTLKELLNRAEILISSGFIHPKSRLHDDL